MGNIIFKLEDNYTGNCLEVSDGISGDGLCVMSIGSDKEETWASVRLQKEDVIKILQYLE